MSILFVSQKRKENYFIILNLFSKQEYKHHKIRSDFKYITEKTFEV